MFFSSTLKNFRVKEGHGILDWNQVPTCLPTLSHLGRLSEWEQRNQGILGNEIYSP